MITHIQKRDGRKVPFNLEKIANAVFKAAGAVGGTDFDTAMEIAVKVADIAEKSYKIPTVEQIQDLVEKVLIEDGHAKTAKAYILYRFERTRIRDTKSKLMKELDDITFKSAEEVDLKRENANIDGNTAMGTMLKYGSVTAKEYYQRLVLDAKHSEAH
ncbi:MAG: anaerobic ribonucleoside triphosphate reductase, partial [Oscillospiraceae bacterium]|nr:anaerobic ribonucleoside triphosphate reductase [Oscillospiraceae bacterium]